MIYLLEELRRASATVADEQISALLRDAAKEIEQYEEEARECNQKMEDSDWCRQYREACIKIAEQHEELEKLRALVANGRDEGRPASVESQQSKIS